MTVSSLSNQDFAAECHSASDGGTDMSCLNEPLPCVDAHAAWPDLYPAGTVLTDAEAWDAHPDEEVPPGTTIRYPARLPRAACVEVPSAALVLQRRIYLDLGAEPRHYVYKRAWEALRPDLYECRPTSAECPLLPTTEVQS